MRKLVFKDAMRVARIIKKGNLKDQLSKIAEKTTEENVDVGKLGVEVIMTLLEACGDVGVENEIYSLLGDIFEAENVENMSLETLTEKLKQLAKENNLESFFELASQ